MNHTALHLPPRATKPRQTGLTMVVDGGAPLGTLRHIVASASEYLDFVKFGWGTAVVSNELEAKIRLLESNAIDYYFGGTLFEKHVLQGRFDDFRVLCHHYSCRFVEVSNGTIDLSNQEKAGYVRKLAGDFTVISEVGFKDADRSDMLSPRRWVEYVEDDLSAGATLVTLEARESGSSGICRANGDLRVGLVEELVNELPVARLVFEAPTTALQAYLVRRVGHRRQPRQRAGHGHTVPGDATPRAAGRHLDRLRRPGGGGLLMRTSTDVFHLAIPVDDLDEAQYFYVTLLGCKLARSYPDRVTIDFFGDQLVCHLTNTVRHEEPLSLYPRHFGVTFGRSEPFEQLYQLAQLRKIPFFQDVSTRFEGLAETHRTFVLRDPFDNLLEFKHYRDPRMMY